MPSIREQSLPQKTRFILLLIEVAVLCVGSKLALGYFVPGGDAKGFWFYSALLGLILGSRLDTPFFAKPADVILYAAPAGIALGLASSWVKWDFGETALFAIAVAYCVITGLLGAIAILTKDSVKPFSNAARIFAESLGAPRTIYTVVLGFALYAFHRTSARELGVIGATWFLTAGLSPIEGSVHLGRRLRYVLRSKNPLETAGEVVAYQTPGMLLVRQSPGHTIPIGALLGVHDSVAKVRVALSFTSVGRDEGILIRGIDIAEDGLGPDLTRRLGELPINGITLLDDKDFDPKSPILARKSWLIGVVAPDTTTERLYFEIGRQEGLEEGRLVEALIGHKTVAFQIVGGVTKEEIVQQRNTHGFARGQAQKIGAWDEASRRFLFAKWLPLPNSPVFLKAAETFNPTAESIGHFPGTNYGVSLSSIHDLVTHNTAILGILGVGKSMLAIELVERMLCEGIKVISLDLTNQYAQQLSDFYDQSYEATRLEEIQDAGEKDKEAWHESPDEGGSLPALEEAIRVDLIDFFANENPRRLKIYNPARMVGTKQIKEPTNFQVEGKWQRAATLWAVTPVEITRIVTEVALQLLQGDMVDRARVCLVFEEAHSLVPEWNAVASDSDRSASNGTARAILQGRKFGLGCLLITQRTANVTKTILNQCNTIFAMRTFDETGKDFLANYIGRDYASALSSIPERQAVFFGKASCCENPVLIQLNDRDEFRGVFRSQHPPPQLPPPVAQAAVPVQAPPEPDDIPF